MTSPAACGVENRSGLFCDRPPRHKGNHEASLPGLRGSWIEWGDVVSLVAAKNRET